MQVLIVKLILLPMKYTLNIYSHSCINQRKLSVTLSKKNWPKPAVGPGISMHINASSNPRKEMHGILHMEHNMHEEKHL